MTSIPSIKAAIWQAAAQDLTRVNRSIAATSHREETVEWWQRVYDHLVICPPRKPSKRKEPAPKWVADRYAGAHRKYQLREYPSSSEDFGTIPAVMPDTSKANGLTNFVIRFLTWEGHRATRITSAGRMVKDRYIPSATRRGAADISSTLFGKSVMWEIKVGRDKPSEDQLSEQARERAAGGVYEFIHSGEEFLEWYDKFVYSLSKQTTLL